jgi:hypothetical protein
VRLTVRPRSEERPSAAGLVRFKISAPQLKSSPITPTSFELSRHRLHGDAVERVGVEHYAQWIAGEAPLGEDIEVLRRGLSCAGHFGRMRMKPDDGTRQRAQRAA